MAAAHPIWRDLVSAGERAALNPGVPLDLERRPDVLVVGGGMLGLVTAVFLRRAGVERVTLIERAVLGAGASGGAAGALAPDAHHGTEPASFIRLGRASLALWRRLDAGWPGGLGVENVDWLAMPPLSPGLKRDLPAGARRLTPDDLGNVEPSLSPVDGTVLIPNLARVNPLRAMARLAAEAGSVATGVAATGVARAGDRVATVSTTIGDIVPGAVIFATGIEPRLPGLHLELGGSWSKGHLLATEPAPIRMRVAAGIPLQLEDGSIVAGGTLDHGDLSPEIRDSVIESIKAELDDLIPAARQLDTTHAWCCFRPMSPDGLPVIDRVPGIENAWFTSGHFRTGIMMAPAAGEALARWLTTGAMPDGIADFGCARLTGRGVDGPADHS